MVHLGKAKDYNLSTGLQAVCLVCTADGHLQLHTAFHMLDPLAPLKDITMHLQIAKPIYSTYVEQI